LCTSTAALRKNEETRLEAFEMKGLRKILRVSWTAKETNEWVLNKAGVTRSPAIAEGPRDAGVPVEIW